MDTTAPSDVLSFPPEWKFSQYSTVIPSPPPFQGVEKIYLAGNRDAVCPSMVQVPLSPTYSPRRKSAMDVYIDSALDNGAVVVPEAPPPSEAVAVTKDRYTLVDEQELVQQHQQHMLRLAEQNRRLPDDLAARFESLQLELYGHIQHKRWPMCAQLREEMKSIIARVESRSSFEFDHYRYENGQDRLDNQMRKALMAGRYNDTFRILEAKRRLSAVREDWKRASAEQNRPRMEALSRELYMRLG